MQDNEAIRDALERNVRAVSLRPSVGQGTARTTARLRSGLECEVTEGRHTLTVAMTSKYGGTDAGPNPGVLGRGALASCLAVGYGMWAARMGVPLTSLEVEVEADYDVRGELGVDPEVRPGYLEMRYTVRVESPAPEGEVLRMLDQADRASSYVDIFSRGVPVRRTVEIQAPERV
jgi:uncharacterized OsmC-like protein